MSRGLCMSAIEDAPVLRRMAGAARQQGASSTESPALALAEAVVKASDTALRLGVSVTTSVETRDGREATLERLNADGLYLLLAHGDGTFGLMVIDPDLVAGLVEVMTLGRVAARSLGPRRPTRTDGAMISDWVEAVFTAFETALDKVEDGDWARGYHKADQLEQARTAKLILERGTYRTLTLELLLTGGERKGEIALMLPAAHQRVQRGAAARAEEAAQWQSRLRTAIGGAEVPLRAELWRTRRSLKDLQNLAPGDLLVVPVSTIGRVSLRGLDGRVVVTGRLGQSGGQKAVRVQRSDLPQPDEAPASGELDLAPRAGLASLGHAAMTGGLAMEGAGQSPDLPDIPALGGDEVPGLPGGDRPDLPALGALGDGDHTPPPLSDEDGWTPSAITTD